MSAVRAVGGDAAAVGYTFSPRRVRFDHEATPSHWIPGDPHTSHVFDVLHLLLPAGERWFGEVLREALPNITDPTLQRDVKAFIGQEATHARAHTFVLDHLDELGLDPRPFTRVVEWGFGVGRTRTMWSWLPGPLRRRAVRSYLLWRMAIVAAIEHFTAVLGWWILVTRGPDRAGADPAMMQLLRWHGAEEVEHRSVAFDAYVAVGGGYGRRVVSMLGVAVGMIAAWEAGTWYFMRVDPTVTTKRRGSLLRFRRAAKAGLLPMPTEIARAIPRYLAPRYHPSHECRTQVAADYLATADLGTPARPANGPSAPLAATA